MRADTDLAQDRGANNQILRAILDVVERDPTVTQRLVARELGIAVGLANAYLKRCVRKGLIKVGQIPRRRYAYYITPKGFAEKSRLTAIYLASSFSLFRSARVQCGELFDTAAARGHRRIALLGTGDLAEIATLVAHEHPVEIAETVGWDDVTEPLSIDLESLSQVDAVVVTAFTHTSQIFTSALARFGPERVYAPALLGLQRTRPRADAAEADA
jgi:DNA-binding MarR family transcriptional regulator